MRRFALVLALLSLAACLVAPVAYFRGSLPEDPMKNLFLLSTVVWFAASGFWSARRP
jgi:hypothetical protein